jgi:hypothetical protein
VSVNGCSKERKKKANNVPVVAGTQQNFSNVFLYYYGTTTDADTGSVLATL